VNFRYAGVYLDPSTARLALQNDADAALPQQQCQGVNDGDMDIRAEPSTIPLSSLSFPFSWNFNATVECLQQVTRHMCAFAWDDTCILPALPISRSSSNAAPVDEGERLWEQGSWSETVKAWQVALFSLLNVMNNLKPLFPFSHESHRLKHSRSSLLLA
jgi:hypothetical protein